MVGGTNTVAIHGVEFLFSFSFFFFLEGELGGGILFSRYSYELRRFGDLL